VTIIRNPILPFSHFAAINLFGLLFVKRDAKIDDVLLRHESIHSRQMRELAYVFFYLFYVAEWLGKLFIYGRRAYWNISFEREAYCCQHDPHYLQTRRRWAFFRYLRPVEAEGRQLV